MSLKANTHTHTTAFLPAPTTTATLRPRYKNPNPYTQMSARVRTQNNLIYWNEVKFSQNFKHRTLTHCAIPLLGRSRFALLIESMLIKAIANYMPTNLWLWTQLFFGVDVTIDRFFLAKLIWIIRTYFEEFFYFPRIFELNRYIGVFINFWLVHYFVDRQICQIRFFADLNSSKWKENIWTQILEMKKMLFWIKFGMVSLGKLWKSAKKIPKLFVVSAHKTSLHVH